MKYLPANMLNSFLVSCTEPTELIHELNTRRQIRLLRFVLLLLTISAYVTVPYYWWNISDSIQIMSITFFTNLVLLLILPVVYWYSAHVKTPKNIAIGIIVISVLSVYSIATPEPGEAYQSGLLNYLIVPVLFSAAFLTEVHTLILIVLNALGVVLFVMLFPAVHLLDTELAFITLVSLFILGLLRYQRVTYAEQQKRTASSEQRYRALLQHLPDPLLIHDGQQCLYINQTAKSFLGLSDAVLGQEIANFWRPEHHQAVRKVLGCTHCGEGNVVGFEQGVLFEEEFILPNGQVVPVDVLHTEVVYEDSKACQVIIRDITDRKEKEFNRLQVVLQKERNTIFDAFVREVGHDLKTPLAVILTSLDLMEYKMEKNGVDAYLKHVDNAKLQVNRLKEMLENALFLMRLDKLPDPKLEPLDLVKLGERIFLSFAPLAEAKNIRLDSKLTEFLPLIHGDRRLLERVFTNLLENGLRYTPDDGMLSLKITEESGFAVCEIQDTGIGIAEEDLPNIFDRFYRADVSKEIAKTGMGLGLAIVYEIIKQHNGVITVESKLNKGTCFRFKIPVI